MPTRWQASGIENARLAGVGSMFGRSDIGTSFPSRIHMNAHLRTPGKSHTKVRHRKRGKEGAAAVAELITRLRELIDSKDTKD